MDLTPRGSRDGGRAAFAPYSKLRSQNEPEVEVLIGSIITTAIAIALVVLSFCQPNLGRRRGGQASRSASSDPADKSDPRAVEGDGFSAPWVEERYLSFP
jgi:hypothetical protein